MADESATVSFELDGQALERHARGVGPLEVVRDDLEESGHRLRRSVGAAAIVQPAKPKAV